MKGNKLFQGLKKIPKNELIAGAKRYNEKVTERRIHFLKSQGKLNGLI